MSRQRLFVRSVAALMVPGVFALLAVPAAQAQSPAGSPSTDLSVTPRNGQSAEQQTADNRECQGWAHNQTGFDAESAGGGVSAVEYAAKRSRYARAMGACLEAHGYTVHYTPAATWTPPVSQAYSPPPPPPNYGGQYFERRSAPTLSWSPFHVFADAGYTVTADQANTYFDDGWNTGIGASFFPVPSIPVGLRVDGNYSSFEASRALLDSTNASFGHQNTYGGNVDLQVNFPYVPFAWNQQFYVFGGIGWYREQTVLHQVSVFDDGFCDFYYGCGPYAAVTGTARYTTSWHDSWNAGLGWEIALADHLSLFVEANYLRIRPNSDGQQFVPIKVGVRF